MSMNVKKISTELKIYRILALICIAVMIFHVVDSVAHGIPIDKVFANNTTMPFAFGIFFFMHGIQELVNYRNRNQQKAQDCSSHDESTNGTDADNPQQMSYKNMSSSDKLSFILGACFGAATVGALILLLFVLLV